MTKPREDIPTRLASTLPESTRREVLSQAALLLSAGALASVASVNTAQAVTPSASGGQSDEKPLYDRLGGIFAIAAVVDYFSDQIIKDRVAGARSRNPQLREWHTKQLGRLPGLKFMRTLWVANLSGGPFQYTPTRPGATNLGLEEAHKNLKISPNEFDAVAKVLLRSLNHFKVPEKETNQVMSAFAAHKDEVTKGWRDSQ